MLSSDFLHLFKKLIWKVRSSCFCSQPVLKIMHPLFTNSFYFVFTWVFTVARIICYLVVLRLYWKKIDFHEPSSDIEITPPVMWQDILLQSIWEYYKIHTRSNRSLTTEEVFLCCFGSDDHSNSIPIALWWQRYRNLRIEQRPYLRVLWFL